MIYIDTPIDIASKKSFTFILNKDIKDSKKKIKDKNNTYKMFSKFNLVGKPLIDTDPDMITVSRNAVLESAGFAFRKEVPLIINVEDYRTHLLSELATWVNCDPEKFKSLFTISDKKETLTVEIPNIYECKEKDFTDLVNKWISQMNVNDDVKSIFKSKETIHDMCNKIALLDIGKNYYNYESTTMCGIPWITIEGTVEEWKQLYMDVQKVFRKFDLDFWLDEIGLVNVLEHIIKTISGKVDVEWWNNYYKQGSVEGSGGYDYVTGYINGLFLFNGIKVNEYRYKKQTHDIPEEIDIWGRNKVEINWESIVKINEYSVKISKCDFTWKYMMSTPTNFILLSGLLGISQDQSGAVRPAAKWMIYQKSNEENDSDDISERAQYANKDRKYNYVRVMLKGKEIKKININTDRMRGFYCDPTKEFNEYKLNIGKDKYGYGLSDIYVHQMIDENGIIDLDKYVI